MNAEEKAALLRQLQDELDKATRDHLRVQRELDRIVIEAPSGLPVPDGHQRLVNAGKRCRYAFARYQDAIGRLRAFLNAEESSADDEPGSETKTASP